MVLASPSPDLSRQQRSDWVEGVRDPSAAAHHDRAGERPPTSIMLYYSRYSQSYVVIASNAGDSRNPIWFDNLMANPRASVQIGPDYAEYQARTDRQIPIVILDPLPELEQVPHSPSMAGGLE